MKSLKIIDKGNDNSALSRISLFWNGRLKNEYASWRTPVLSINIRNIDPYKYILDTYKLRTIEFGNWVNNQWRYQYLVGSIVALYDLDKILKFNGNIGMDGTIGLAFGSRGASRALAHFEPHSMMINITRYSRDEQPLTGGGVGSLAHEYGHALDYFFGSRVVGMSWALTEGRSTATRFEVPNEAPGSPKHLKHLAQKVVYNAIWKHNKNGDRGLTKYYLNLLSAFNGNDYWIRHNEIFARAFEQYIQMKLDTLNVQNQLLHKYKYESAAYMDKETFASVAPVFDELIKEMRKYLPKSQTKGTGLSVARAAAH